MREIIFKAKRVDNGEWVQGNLFVEGNRAEITRGTCNGVGIEGVSVDKDTICQYTGLTDKNGNKIWENDIIGYWDTYNTENGYAEADCVGTVLWDDETLSFQVTERLSAESYEVLDECSVIGNIFDNADLLKGE